MVINGSSNNLPCYPPGSHWSQNAVYWRKHLLEKYISIAIAVTVVFYAAFCCWQIN